MFRCYILLVLSIMLFINGCDDNSEPPVETEIDFTEIDFSVLEFEPANIGVLLPLTGSQTEIGKARKQVVQLAYEDLKRAGYLIQTTIVDTKTDDEVAIKKALDLINEGAQIFVGPSITSATKAVATEVAILNDIPQIANGSLSPDLTSLADKDLVFQMVPSITFQTQILAKLVYHQGDRNVVIFYVNDEYGNDFKNALEESFNALNNALNEGKSLNSELDQQISIFLKLGAENTGTEENDETSESDNSNKKNISFLSQPYEANEEDVEYYQKKLSRFFSYPYYLPRDETALIAISYPKHLKIYLDEAIKNRFNHIFLANTDSQITEGGLSQEAMEKLAGICGTNNALTELESFNIFKQNLEMLDNSPNLDLPNHYLPHTYDAIVVAALAAYATQIAGNRFTSLNIRDQLRKVAGSHCPSKEEVLPNQVIAGAEGLKQALIYLQKKQPINYFGASGSLDFDKNGDVVTPIEIWCKNDQQETMVELLKPLPLLNNQACD